MTQSMPETLALRNIGDSHLDFASARPQQRHPHEGDGMGPSMLEIAHLVSAWDKHGMAPRDDWSRRRIATPCKG